MELSRGERQGDSGLLMLITVTQQECECGGIENNEEDDMARKGWRV